MGPGSLVDKGQGLVLPRADGGALHLAVESGQRYPGQRYLEASKRHADLARRDAYVAPLMKAAARTFGRAAPEAG